MSAPSDDDRRRGVYARLAEQEEQRYAARVPPRATRLVGWGLCLAITAMVVMAALQVQPW